MLNTYDAQLRIRSLVPNFDAYLARYKELSDETRQVVRHELDMRYGDSAQERLDIFHPPSNSSAVAPIHVFFHGGYWRAFDKSDYSFIARPITEYGAIAIVANYGLMPAVSMEELLCQCRSVIRWLYQKAESLGGNPEQISVSGHSAGGHIASILHLTDWREFGMPTDSIKATIAVSGIYDLNAVLHSFLKEETGMTELDVARFSPIGWTQNMTLVTRRLVLSVGGREANEMRRQTETFGATLRHHGVPVDLRFEPERHHMDIILDLADPSSRLGNLLLKRIGTTGAPSGAGA